MPSGHGCVSCVNVTREGHEFLSRCYSFCRVPCFIEENEEGGRDIGFNLPWNELRLRQIHDNCYKSDLDVVSMGVACYGLPFTSR